MSKFSALLSIEKAQKSYSYNFYYVTYRASCIAYSECCDISGQKIENSENSFWSTILKPLLQSL